MKYKFFLLCSLFSITISAVDLVVVLMVKNESAVIVETLQPYIDGGVTRYVVLDTGSTDDTVEKVKQLFIDYHIDQGYVVQQDFVNFAVSRNYAITCAEQLFEQDCLLFMPDAEWYMQNVAGLIQFCHESVQEDDDSFLVLLRHEKTNFQFYVQRLFRAHQGIRFEGVVHETINRSTVKKVSSDIYISWNPSVAGCEKSQNRWYRDLDLLLKDVQEHPENTRTVFYLAQTYECLQNLEQAAIWYKKRSEMVGWSEENYMSFYRLAGVYSRMNAWKWALHYYLQAFNNRPSRAEPLVKIAQYYWHEGQYALCYMFALAACEIPYPQEDFLFIEKELYDYTRYDVLGCAAWYLQKYDIGKRAVEKALSVHPDYPHLIHNLDVYKKQLS